MFSRTLLLLLAIFLVIFILAIVISPYADLPQSALRAQAIVLTFFAALVWAIQFCVRLRCDFWLPAVPPLFTAEDLRSEPPIVLLC